MNVVVYAGRAGGAVLGQLGMSGVVGIAVLFALGFVVWKFFDWVDRILVRVEKRWRGWSRPTRYALVAAVVVLIGPSLWAAFPKNPGVLIVVVSVATWYFLQGFVYVNRYQLEEASAWDGWSHHRQVSRLARQHSSALGDATTKKGGKARRPTITSDATSFPITPPHGMSAEEVARDYNEGRITSAMADRMGWPSVEHGMQAHVMPDGTVRVDVLSAPESTGFYQQVQQWPGMESA